MAVELGQQTVELGTVVRRAAEESYLALREIVDKSRAEAEGKGGQQRLDTEKKIDLLKFIDRTRQRMLRLHVLTKWCQQPFEAPRRRVDTILRTGGQQGVDVADGEGEGTFALPDVEEVAVSMDKQHRAALPQRWLLFTCYSTPAVLFTTSGPRIAGCCSLAPSHGP